MKERRKKSSRYNQFIKDNKLKLIIISHYRAKYQKLYNFIK